MGLTAPESKAYLAIMSLQVNGKTITRDAIGKATGNLDKSWTCRILKSLIEKKLIERYEQRYYRLTA